MRQVNIHDAKTNFSQLVADVEQGAEIIIARAGQPVARLVPLRAKSGPRKPGSARGRLEVPASFFEPLPEDALLSFET